MTNDSSDPLAAFLDNEGDVPRPPNPPASELGALLLRIRGHLGLTLTSAADRADTEEWIWARWERGEVIPSDRHLQTLCARIRADTPLRIRLADLAVQARQRDLENAAIVHSWTDIRPPTAFGRWVMAHLVRLGMAQRELARRTGLARQSITDLFYADQPHRYDTVGIICRALDCDPAEGWEIAERDARNIDRLIDAPLRDVDTERNKIYAPTPKRVIKHRALPVPPLFHEEVA